MDNEILSSFIYNNPTKIFFGSGKLGELHTEPLPGKKALILTSSGSSYKINGSFEKVKDELSKSGVEYIHLGNIGENPLKESCEEAGAFARAQGCDFIVALGGGSVLDSAIAAAIMATNQGDLWDYVEGGSGKGRKAPNQPLPIVTIPTTSGTGSEVNECAVISREDTKEKVGIGDRRCKPVLAIVDPLYMRTVPPRYTAYQGFDAFFHHAEAMMSKRLNILSERIALSAISEINKYLPLAIEDGNNLEAREHMAFAATMSGFTMQLTRITAQHSMEHAMSAFHRILPHGAGLIMISKAFALFFIERHAGDDRFIRMARAMGYPNSNNPYDYIDALERLKERCGVSKLKLSDYGITTDECMSLAQAARLMQPGGHEVTLCGVTDEDIAEIFRKSFE